MTTSKLDRFLDDLDAGSGDRAERKVTISLDGEVIQCLDELVTAAKNGGRKLSYKEAASQLISWGYEQFQQRIRARGESGVQRTAPGDQQTGR